MSLKACRCASQQTVTAILITALNTGETAAVSDLLYSRVTYIVGDVTAAENDVIPRPNDDVSRRIHATSTTNSERTM